MSISVPQPHQKQQQQGQGGLDWPGMQKWWLLPVVAAVPLLIWGGSAVGSPEARARASKRAAIEQCWQQGQKASCERLEADFRARFGTKR